MNEISSEISSGVCINFTWRCTISEALGLYSSLFFFCTVLFTTIIHNCMLHGSNRDDEATRRQTGNNDLTCCTLCVVVFYFFSLVFGCFLWAHFGVQSVHPFQYWPIQMAGTLINCLCIIGFLSVHVTMGDNWSPEPEQRHRDRHKLVTSGLFRFARHPMYAIFLWATLGTLFATLNWVLALIIGLKLFCVSRIETEERILLELYGEDYRNYADYVSVLGFPWSLCYQKKIKSIQLLPN